jgi:hypothetical protein
MNLDPTCGKSKISRASATFKMGRYIGRHFFVIVCTGGLLFGAGIVISGQAQWRRQFQSLHWPKTEGKMVQGNLASRIRRYGRFSNYREYFAEITYTYEVDDRKYVSHRIGMINPDFAASREQVRQFLDGHPTKSEVDVFYDPAHPDFAVLLPQVDELGHRFYRWDGFVLILAGGLGLARRVFSSRGRAQTLGFTKTWTQCRSSQLFGVGKT